uniref:Uncharacterized protein n=2 Tax=Ixodes scapularis TaxID=6945 RepID=A0A1S4KYM9_IXOSC
QLGPARSSRQGPLATGIAKIDRYLSPPVAAPPPSARANFPPHHQSRNGTLAALPPYESTTPKQSRETSCDRQYPSPFIARSPPLSRPSYSVGACLGGPPSLLPPLTSLSPLQLSLFKENV